MLRGEYFITRDERTEFIYFLCGSSRISRRASKQRLFKKALASCMKRKIDATVIHLRKPTGWRCLRVPPTPPRPGPRWESPAKKNINFIHNLVRIAGGG